MKDAKQLLLEADTLLGRISISGDDVFLMADARSRLKAAYDLVPVEKAPSTKEKEDAVNG